jgi:hypothetical protein
MIRMHSILLGCSTTLSTVALRLNLVGSQHERVLFHECRAYNSINYLMICCADKNQITIIGGLPVRDIMYVQLRGPSRLSQ